MTSKVKDQVSGAPTVVKEVLPSTGSIKLQMEKPVTIEQANGELVVVGNGSPSIFQIRSYSKRDRFKMPSVFFHATTNATSMEQLVGKSIEGTLFIQYDSTGSIWRNSDENPTKLLVESLDKGELFCRVTSNVLLGATGGQTPVTGEIRAIVPPSRP